MKDWDELIAHRVDSLGLIDVYDIRDPSDWWVAQVRVNHHRRKAEWLYAPGHPVSALAATLTDEAECEAWLVRHRCNCIG